MKNKLEERFYPSGCLSAVCPKCIGNGCDLNCYNWTTLQEFNMWKEKHKAIKPDHIWSPTFYKATI